MGGAKNCPETPRQKMIGMMYLVLTAMLALNVSSSILEGFTLVDNSLHTTIESANVRNKAQYEDFQALCDKNPTKVKEWLDKAKIVKSKSDELFNYIQKFKTDIVKITDKDEANDSAYVKQIKAKDNFDKPGEYAIVGGHGKELKKKIDDYVDFLVKLSAGNPVKINMYKSIFSTQSIRTQDGTLKPWVDAVFEGVPVAAVITILTKYQSDIRASEAELVQYLKAQTDASDFRVNKIEALVIPESKYVIKGDRYKARIVLSAVDSTQKPNYFVNGSSVANGLYEVGCGVVGQKTFSGQISIPGNDGIMRVYPFKSEYMVGEPTATMSNEDLNVFYKGYENKLSVSVPGVAAANISIKAEGATAIQKGPGRYIIRPMRDGEVKINVFAMIDKKNLPMGSGIYRVRPLPDPKIYLQLADGKQVRNCKMSFAAVKGAQLVASYGNDELIKANFAVISFTMISRNTNSLQNVTGSRLNAAFLDKLPLGDQLVFRNIKVMGPDQVPRDLGLMGIDF